MERRLWPLVETLLGSHEMAGVAVAVVREDVVVSRGFGVRDVGSGASVTPETMFHLASVSKPFVATAIVSPAAPRDGGEPVLDLMPRSSSGCLNSRWPTVGQRRSRPGVC
jgi:hypothetical protein